MADESLIDRIRQNPFYVLGVHTECSRHELEREGQKLLSMLALDLSEAKTYVTPLGVQPRTPELVRFAMGELRDPARRLLHELLATLPCFVTIERQRAPSQSGKPWPEALAFFGYGPRRRR